MRRSVTYRLEKDDPRELSAERIGEIETLLQDVITDEDRDRSRRPAPGLKAMGLIKGNMPIEVSDVRALAAYVEELCVRMEKRREGVLRERNAAERDERSLVAYDFLIDGMQASVDRARKLIGEFEETFLRLMRYADAEPATPAEDPEPSSRFRP